MKPLSTHLPYPGKATAFVKPILVACLLLLSFNAHAQLPQAVKDIIDTSLKNWNKYYGSHVQAISWSDEGLITTASERQAAVDEITDPAKAWIPTGDISTPDSVSAQRVVNDTSLSAADLTDFKTMVDTLVKVGQHRVRITWMKGNITFTTLAVTNETVPVYDNMLINIALTAHHSVCFDLHIGWIWQSTYETMTRGAIYAELKTNCTPEGRVISCDPICRAGVTLGDAKIMCEVETINNGYCCQMKFAWAWKVGLRKIKLKAGKFEFELEGILGSGGAGNGSCTECCTTLVSPPPSFTVNTVCESDNVLISWEIKSAFSFKQYTIESSMDGIRWDYTGRVAGIAAAGLYSNYTYKDMRTGKKGNFYRITGEQISGIKTYSALIASPCGVIQNITVAPNPAGAVATVRIPSARAMLVTVSVTNAQGFEVFRDQYNLHLGNNEYLLNMKNLANGVYTLRVTSMDGLQKVYRLMRTNNR